MKKKEKISNKKKETKRLIKEFFKWESVEMISHYNDASAADDFGKYFSADGIIQQENKGIADIK